MITYYTDGSASPNPGPGGFAVIKNGQPYMIGGEPSGEITTNIRMEGLAIKTALTDADGAECQIYTDSEFWINVITKWAPSWAANGWKKKGGEIKNLDIVQDVYPLYVKSDATLTWVRGHEGDEGNEMADEWANNARQRKATLPEKLIAAVPMTLEQHVHAHLRAGQTMQLATLHDGAPRVCTVYYVPSKDDAAVYWFSEPERVHSINIISNPRVAAAIAVKNDMPVIGLQCTGVAEVVADITQIEYVTSEYSAKYKGQAKNYLKQFSAGAHKHSLYKMTIQSLDVFDELHYPNESPVKFR